MPQRRSVTDYFVFLQRRSPRLPLRYRQAPCAENACSQPASSFQGCLRSGTKGTVHPEAGPTLLSSQKANITNGELVPDQVVQPYAASKDIAPENGWRPVPDP